MVREGNKHEPVIFTKESEEWPFLRAFPWIQSVSITQEWRWVTMLRSGGREHQEPQEKLLTIKSLPFPITYRLYFLSSPSTWSLGFHFTSFFAFPYVSHTLPWHLGWTGELAFDFWKLHPSPEEVSDVTGMEMTSWGCHRSLLSWSQ